MRCRLLTTSITALTFSTDLGCCSKIGADTDGSSAMCGRQPYVLGTTTSETTTDSTSTSTSQPTEDSPSSTSESTSTTTSTTTDPSETTTETAESTDSSSSTTMPNPFCGDGVVNQANEECDRGSNNAMDNNNTYGTCNKDCTLAPYCGDKNVDLEHMEVCDDGNTDDDDGCPNSCQADHYLVFLTAQSRGGDFGGLIGADELCQDEASGLTGTYVAWLSSSTEPSAVRIGLKIDLNKRFHRRDGQLVATSWNSLKDGDLENPISRTAEIMVEEGEPVNVWTNTDTNGDGQSAVNHCNNWTNGTNDYFSSYGLSIPPLDKPNSWTIILPALDCSNKFHLYCFQVSFDTPTKP